MRTVTSTALALTFLLAAAGASAQETTVEVVRGPVPDSAATFERGFVLRLSGGGRLPLTGPLADLGNAGIGARIAAGTHFLPGLAALVEVGAARIPRAKGDDLGHGVADAWLLVRAAFVVDEALHLFGEVGGGVVFVGPQPGTGLSLGGAEAAGAAAVAGGLEVDLFDGISGEGGLRIEYLATGSAWGGATLLASPYLAATLHL